MELERVGNCNRTVAFRVVYDLSNSFVHITEHYMCIRQLCVELAYLLVQHFVVLRDLLVDLLHASTPDIIVFFVTRFRIGIGGTGIAVVEQHTRRASQRQYTHAYDPPHIHVVQVPYDMYHLIC